MSAAEQKAPQTISVGGLDVRIHRRKGMRNIRIRVDEDGSVRVSAPYGVPALELERFVEARRGWIEETRRRTAASSRGKAAAAGPEELEAWREAVAASTELLLERWQPVIGVRVRKFAFRNMKSRWGSCQPATGRVCINIRLALYPPRCLEYVVVHELCHMLVPNHGSRFKELLDRYLPDWREAERLLKG